MLKIEVIKEKNWLEVKAIYEEGVKTRNATFETNSPSWEVWDNAHLKCCRLLAVFNGMIVGWAALSGVSGRCVYAGVAEVSVYVSSMSRGKGFGKLLLLKLIEESEANNLWTLQAGIFPENEASLHLHQSLGFRMIGTRERIGKMNGVWRDTLLLERRSSIVGL